MRLYTYLDRGEDRIGVLSGERLVSAKQLSRADDARSSSTYQSICCVIQDPDWQSDFEHMLRQTERAKARARTPTGRIPLPAIQHPSKIVCVGLNYREHAAEGGREPPRRPLLFA
ncbi:MAG: hypothetical protein ACTS8Z_05995, partial [Candidatus Limnocylindrales bacterium]